MPFVSSATAAPAYDVLIVGSGAAGAQVAYVLAMEGVKVLMIEAGRRYEVTESPMFKLDSEAPLHGASTPDKPLGFSDATVDGGFTVPGEPYSTVSTPGEENFVWWRSRMLGGRTNHWGRQAQRQGPYDFKPRSRDGLGVDWPISYAEIAPYYDKAEMLIGVSGENGGPENCPDASPGVLLPAPKPRIGDLLIANRARKFGMRTQAIHNAILSRRQDHLTIPQRLHPGNAKAQRLLAQSMQSRSACLFATTCVRGCSVKANYQSTSVQIPPALATGNLDILTGAMAREVLTNARGLASGVAYIDKASGQEHQVGARVVVLAGGSMESVRLLFNSKSNRFPSGLGNSSGELGRHLIDSISTDLTGQIPLLENLPRHNEDGFAGMHHTHIPWWGYGEQKQGKLNFARGYEILYTTGRQMPSSGMGANLDRLSPGSFGRQLKEDARRYYGSIVTLKGEGAMIPNDRSYCEIDPKLKDRWGIPVLRFHWARGEHEFNQAIHQQKTFAELFSALGGRLLNKPDLTGRKVMLPGGHLKHEAGGARMGADPRNSVTNSWGQTWDVKNLFVADGALFCGNSDKGPTLTILALAWRTADGILAAMKRGDLS